MNEKNLNKIWTPILLLAIFLILGNTIAAQNQKGDIIKIKYYVYDENSKLIETNDLSESFGTNATIDPRQTFLLGYNQFPKKVERRLITSSPGDYLTFTLTPEEAFGTYDQNKTSTINTSTIRKAIGEEPYTGEIIIVNNQIAKVTRVYYNETSVVDLNPDYAGQTIKYKIIIKEIRKPSAPLVIPKKQESVN